MEPRADTLVCVVQVVSTMLAYTFVLHGGCMPYDYGTILHIYFTACLATFTDSPRDPIHTPTAAADLTNSCYELSVQTFQLT